MADVFVSYASQDRSKVVPLVRALETAGLSVWWDRDIDVGATFDREIEDQLARANCVLVIWSSASVESEWVREEAQEGLDRRILLPVRIDGCRLPLGFRRVQTADLLGWPGRRDGFDALLSRALALVGERGDSESSPGPSGVVPPSIRWRPGLILVMLAGLIALLALSLSYFSLRSERSLDRWADEQIRSIELLLDDRRYSEAFAATLELDELSPARAEISELIGRTSHQVRIRTEPPGVDVSFRAYGTDDEWQSVGRTPLEARVPLGGKTWRLRSEGYEEQLISSYDSPSRFSEVIRMPEAGSVPSGMVFVPGGLLAMEDRTRVPVASFLLGRHEVTNAEFQAFVDGGGYLDFQYWRNAFAEGGVDSEGEARRLIASFTDRTGRPGPATWQLGRFPEGSADEPVRGVSWYEAMAYASFSGARLPTIAHWETAAFDVSAIGIRRHDHFLEPSIFEASGPSPVGVSGALARVGAVDMFGNVREWGLNQVDTGRAMMGGSYLQYPEIAWAAEVAPPANRSEMNGFRIAVYGPDPQLEEPLDRPGWEGTPVSDDAYQLLAGELEAKALVMASAPVPFEVVESVFWRRETVRLERPDGSGFRVHVYLPRSQTPPYQVVLYGPGVGVAFRDEFEGTDPGHDPKYVVRSGRALVFPEYYGTFGHPAGRPPENVDELPQWERELMLNRRWDTGYAIDFIASRDDLDSGRLAYLGFSESAAWYLPVLAVEDRFRTAVLVSGGLELREPLHPLTDTINFLERITLPVLLVAGDHDGVYPYETSQKPLLEMLGSGPGRVKRVGLNAGHSGLPASELMRHVVDWLDEQLGPVVPATR
jgi:pimeloyl-ACP methyl ester carboxylesterase